MRIISLIIILLLPTVVFGQGASSLGAVAMNLLSPVTIFSDFVNTGCLVIGGSFIFASIVRYFEHRRSPLMVPISTVIFLLVAGIILILLPFLYLVTKSGIPYSLIH